MAPNPSKPLIWLLEEATPEVAHLMHQLERAFVNSARVQRVSYMEALRLLPREDVRTEVQGILVFSPRNAQNLASLLKGYQSNAPRLCLMPPTYEGLAQLKPAQRWQVPISAVARHLGEAALLVASGIKPENVVRLQADLDLAAMDETARAEDAPLRVGLAWYNLAPFQQEAIAAEIGRWQQSASGRLEWHVFHLPNDAPPDWGVAGVHAHEVNAAFLAEPKFQLDVLLTDPWWPAGLPRPFQGPVQIFLAPGGAPGDGWQERLQAVVDLEEPQAWTDAMLLQYRFQPLTRHLIAGEERPPVTIPQPDLIHLEVTRRHLHHWLTAKRAAWPTSQDEMPADIGFTHWIYDLRVQVSWFLHMWEALATAKNGDRHAILLAINAVPLQPTSSSWLFKRLLARTSVSKSRSGHRLLPRSFWYRFATQHPGMVLKLLRALWTCGKDEATLDPLVVSREVATQLLTDAGVTLVRRNEPAPVAGVPTIYLMSHRNGELDPFLLLSVLPGQLAVVVGPRAQRWPLIGRLGHSSAFVLTGRERGVVIADAIAAVRSRRALALYPEPAEPTYLGEGGPLRNGLIWIIQALERSQVIPVVLNDAFTGQGTVDVWFGAPILCTPETRDEVLHQVRMFFHRHVQRMNSLDEDGKWVEKRVDEAVPEAESVEPTA
jgi:hypothetical protein